MKKYIAPELEVANFNVEDIVTLSIITASVDFTEENNGALTYTSNYVNG